MLTKAPGRNRATERSLRRTGSVVSVISFQDDLPVFALLARRAIDLTPLMMVSSAERFPARITMR